MLRSHSERSRFFASCSSLSMMATALELARIIGAVSAIPVDIITELMLRQPIRDCLRHVRLSKMAIGLDFAVTAHILPQQGVALDEVHLGWKNQSISRCSWMVSGRSAGSIGRPSFFFARAAWRWPVCPRGILRSPMERRGYLIMRGPGHSRSSPRAIRGREDALGRNLKYYLVFFTNATQSFKVSVEALFSFFSRRLSVFFENGS